MNLRDLNRIAEKDAEVDAWLRECYIDAWCKYLGPNCVEDYRDDNEVNDLNNDCND